MIVIPVSIETQAAYKALVKRADDAFEAYQTFSKQASGFLESLRPENYKEPSLYDRMSGKIEDTIANGYLLLGGVVEDKNA